MAAMSWAHAALVLVALLGVAHAGRVYELKDEDIASAVAENEALVILFDNPACKSCREMIEAMEEHPEEAKEVDTEMLAMFTLMLGCGKCGGKDDMFHEVADLYEDTGVMFAKVESKMEGVDIAVNIEEWPTIVLFKLGHAYPYAGKETTEALSYHLHRTLSPPSTLLESVDEVYAWLEVVQHVGVVGLFTDEDDNDSLAFQQVASFLIEAFYFEGSFAHVVDPKVIAAFEPDNMPTVAMFRDFDEEKIVYPGATDDMEALAMWVYDNSFPIVSEFSEANQRRYVERGLPLFWLFVEGKDDDADAALVTEFYEVARENRAHFIHVVDNDAEHQRHLGFNYARYPALAIQALHRGLKFIYEGDEVNKETIAQFAQDYFDDKLLPHIRSEDVPTSEEATALFEETGTIKLVGYNYEKVVLSEDVDVIVYYANNWCEACKKFEPTFRAFAQETKHIDSLVVARFNVGKNEAPPFAEGHDFPDVYIFPADNKEEPVVFTGVRTVEGLLKWARDYSYMANEELVNLELTQDYDTVSGEDEEEEDDEDDTLALPLGDEEAGGDDGEVGEDTEDAADSADSADATDATDSADATDATDAPPPRDYHIHEDL